MHKKKNKRIINEIGRRAGASQQEGAISSGMVIEQVKILTEEG
jgi:hypothetical protein